MPRLFTITYNFLVSVRELVRLNFSIRTSLSLKSNSQRTLLQRRTKTGHKVENPEA